MQSLLSLCSLYRLLLQEFSYWFSNPLTGMVEGNKALNSELIGRLHSLMRPFLLRRLKKDVAKQLPAKHEHIVFCKLSKRQLHLYEDFMARSSTRALLEGGNYMGMMNILMQLRKVRCVCVYFSELFRSNILVLCCAGLQSSRPV